MSWCYSQADFVQVGNRTKGFCTNCLRLAIMIEKDVQVDSDGEKVDFSDKSTVEFLFKDYWEIVKKKEGLTLGILQEAHASLDSENFPKEKHSSDDDFFGNIDDVDDEPSRPSNVIGTSKKVKALRKQRKSKKYVYDGWGSKVLIEFLESIGKDTSKPLDQFGATEVVKEYIRQKNLSQKDKKTHVTCDDKLQSLFGTRRKEIRFTKIYSLLEQHIASNATSEDETLSSSEDNADSFRKKKTRTMTSESTTPKGISERHKRCFASLVPENIKLIYLRRSLVLDLLKHPETFENKVIGCFVRVKNDPKDYRRPKSSYQLGQVIGIRKSSEEYKIRDVSTNMLLCVSSYWSEVKISMLSDEDFDEDECEHLRMLVKKENSERNTVAELEEKVRNVHSDIVSHWIDKELQRLEKLIEVANEKGWRYEMHELIEKRRLLRTQSERQRLLEEVPQVIPDLEDNKDAELLVASADKSFQINTSIFQGASGERVVCLKSCSQEIYKGAGEERAPWLESCSEVKSKGADEKAVCLKGCSEENSEDDNDQTVCSKIWSEEIPKATEAEACTPATCVQNQAIAVQSNAAAYTPRTYVRNKGSKDNAASDGLEKHVQKQGTEGSKDNAAADRLGMHVQKQGIEVKSNAAGGTPRTYVGNQGTQGSKDNAAGDGLEKHAPKQGAEVNSIAAGYTLRRYVRNQVTQGSKKNAAGDRLGMHVQKQGTKANEAGITGDVEVIILDDDDDSVHDECANITVDLDANNSRDTHIVQLETWNMAMWYYTDPQDDEQGPFTLKLLQRWKEEGFFDADFRVWRAGQSSDSAILLTDALRLKC